MDIFIVLKQYSFTFTLYHNNIWNWIKNEYKHENYQ